MILLNIFDDLFKQGNIWGIIIVAMAFIGIAIAQYFHEDGAKWARPVQYGIGLVFLAIVIFVFAL